MFGEKLIQNTHRLLDKRWSSAVYVVGYLAIKYLYMMLCMLILKDAWYVGYGSYGIDFVWWKEILATAIFIPTVWVLAAKTQKARFADNVLHLLTALYYIPLNSSFALNNQPFLYYLCSNLFFMLLAVCTLGILSVGQKSTKIAADREHDSYRKEAYSDRNVVWFLLLVCLLFIAFKLCYNGLSLSTSMDANDVYEERGLFGEFLDSIAGTPFSYLLSILRNAASYAIPLCVLISLLNKQWLFAVVGCIGVLAQFSVSASKATLLTLAIVAVVYACWRLKLLDRFVNLLQIGMVALMVVCVAELALLGTTRIFTLIVRRMMYIPAWLNTMYFEFFTENSPVFWTQNVFLLQNIFEPVYDVGPLTLISEAFFGGVIPSPNAGLLAEAVMHFGLVGVVIYPIIIAVVIAVSGLVYHDYGLCVQIFMAIELVIHLQNTPITRTDSVLSYFLLTAALLVLPHLHMQGLRNLKNDKNRK